MILCIKSWRREQTWLCAWTSFNHFFKSRIGEAISKEKSGLGGQNWSLMLSTLSTDFSLFVLVHHKGKWKKVTWGGGGTLEFKDVWPADPSSGGTWLAGDRPGKHRWELQTTCFLFPEMQLGDRHVRICKQGLSVNKQILLAYLLALLPRDSVQPSCGTLVTSILWHQPSRQESSNPVPCEFLKTTYQVCLALWQSRGELVTPPSVSVPSRPAGSSTLWE